MSALAIDLYCGLGGWTEGLLAEGYDVIGFDIERHDYGEGRRYPAQLVLQDVTTIHGSQLKDAALIVASPPCQEYSYMAMPWSRAKAIAAEYRSGARDVAKLTALFDACFRIQREAIEAAGHFIPLIVENVRGAQPWVGRSRWNFGSFHLWGDVPALMPMTVKAQKFNPDGTNHGQGSWFAIADSQNRGTKVGGLDWNGYKNGDPDYRGQAFNTHAERIHKVPGFRFDGSGRSFQSASVEGTKYKDADGYEREHPEAFGWRMPRTSSHSHARKAASAAIAKIPLPLSRYIGRVYA